jgi:Fe-S cluster assembly iron-binding protein IscA
MLRISVEGGGCSGFQYKFDVERARADDDLVIERDSAVVLVDPPPCRSWPDRKSTSWTT